jgi:hypothetical protein
MKPIDNQQIDINKVGFIQPYVFMGILREKIDHWYRIDSDEHIFSIWCFDKGCWVSWKMVKEKLTTLLRQSEIIGAQ